MDHKAIVIRLLLDRIQIWDDEYGPVWKSIKFSDVFKQDYRSDGHIEVGFPLNLIILPEYKD